LEEYTATFRMDDTNRRSRRAKRGWHVLVMSQPYLRYIAVAILAVVMVAGFYFMFRYVASYRIYAQSLEAEEAGRLDEAKDGYLRAISLYSSNADANYQLGSVMRKQGDVLEALKYTKRAIELNSNNPDYNLGLGFIYFNYYGDIKKAKLYVNKAYTLDKKNYYACFMLGSLEERENHTSKAVAFYTEAVKQNPAFIPSYKRLASIYAAEGNEKKAVEYWQKVLSLNKNDADAQSFLASRSH